MAIDGADTFNLEEGEGRRGGGGVLWSNCLLLIFDCARHLADEIIHRLCQAPVRLAIRCASPTAYQKVREKEKQENEQKPPPPPPLTPHPPFLPSPRSPQMMSTHNTTPANKPQLLSQMMNRLGSNGSLGSFGSSPSPTPGGGSDEEDMDAGGAEEGNSPEQQFHSAFSTPAPRPSSTSTPSSASPLLATGNGSSSISTSSPASRLAQPTKSAPAATAPAAATSAGRSPLAMTAESASQQPKQSSAPPHPLAHPDSPFDEGGLAAVSPPRLAAAPPELAPESLEVQGGRKAEGPPRTPAPASAPVTPQNRSNNGLSNNSGSGTASTSSVKKKRPATIARIPAQPRKPTGVVPAGLFDDDDDDDL